MTSFPDNFVTLNEITSQMCYVYINALAPNENGEKMN